MLNLSENEVVVMDVKKHKLIKIGGILLTVIGLPFLIIGALPGIYCLLRYKCDKLVLTDRKFYPTEGVIFKKHTSAPLDKINTVDYSQGPIGRIFSYGTLLIQTAATGGVIKYYNVVDPAGVQCAITNEIERHNGRGKYDES